MIPVDARVQGRVPMGTRRKLCVWKGPVDTMKRERGLGAKNGTTQELRCSESSAKSCSCAARRRKARAAPLRLLMHGLYSRKVPRDRPRPPSIESKIMYYTRTGCIMCSRNFLPLHSEPIITSSTYHPEQRPEAVCTDAHGKNSPRAVTSGRNSRTDVGNSI